MDALLSLLQAGLERDVLTDSGVSLSDESGDERAFFYNKRPNNRLVWV